MIDFQDDIEKPTAELQLDHEPEQTSLNNISKKPQQPASSSLFDDDDDDDDIFKSARIEPEPAKISFSSVAMNGEGDTDKDFCADRVINDDDGEGETGRDDEPRDDIPLEDEDENPFEDAHLKPQLQLSGSSPAPATIGHTTGCI